MAKNTYKQDEVLEEPFDIRHLLRASSYIKKYAGRMVVAILLSGIGGAFGYVAPMIIQRALDLAIPDKNEKLLFSLVGMLVGIYVVSVIFTTIRSRIMVDVSQNIIYDIRKDLFEHLQELPFQYYDDRPHGKILIRVVNYVNSVSDMLSNGLINIVLECFNLLFIVIFMFLVDVQMALVVLCGVPVLCVFMVWIKNKQRRAWQAVSNKNSNLNAYLQENIVGARITQIFAREDENAEIFKDLSTGLPQNVEHGGALFQPGMAGHRFNFRLRARGDLLSRPCAVRTGQQITRYHRGDFQLRIVLLAADHEPWKYLQQLYQQHCVSGTYL